MFGGRVHDQGRKDLLQNIAVLFEDQAEELLDVMRDQVDLQPVVDSRFLDCFRARLQTDDFFERQEVRAPQIVVRIGGGKAVQMPAADRGKQQRIRVPVDLLLQTGVHWRYSAAASRRALIRKSFARS